MFYPEELIQEVISRNDIVDVVSGYVRLQKKGNNYWGLCPFHSEKSASFSVNGPKQMFHCFGCGAGGNVFTFLMKYENYTFQEAVKVLADRGGVKLPEMEETPQMKAKASRRARLLEVNKEAAKFFYYQLRSPQGSIGMKYLEGRKLSEETMKKFGLGYSGKNGTDLIKYLKQKGFDDGIIKDAGLASFTEKAGMSSQFWNRVMFPIQDMNHRVIGFGGRVMGDAKPKYLNSPETDIFDKKRNLYGLNFARSARANNMIICEGYMDVIAMHQAGFTQAVASLGTAFTSEQANLLHRFTENVLLAYDSDDAGVKAALRGIEILRGAGLTGKIINMKPYKDPDEFIKNLGRDEFQKRIDNAENSFFFEIRILEEKYNQNDPDERTKFHREIAARLCNFEEDVERENYLAAISEKYHINSENMRKLVVSVAANGSVVKPMERPKSGVKPKNTPEDNVRKSQRLLLTWLTDEPKLYGKIKQYISPSDFTVDIYRQVTEKLFPELEQGTMNLASIISMFNEEEEQQEVASLFNTSLPMISTPQEREKAFHDIVYSVKKNSYEYYVSQMGTDMSAINKVIEGKKALETLSKTHISLE